MFNLGNAEKNLLVSKNENNKYYDENIKIDINDHNNTHAIIASYVKDGAVCLDVGCGAGYTGELLKNNRNSKVYGIDIDAEALKKAKIKNVYKEVYNFSITDSTTDEYRNFFESSLKFDYIIFADVLEHVIDPANLIYSFSKKLNKGGKILVSVPNVAHMDICTNIINRVFNYNKIGILDNTHLRFFTKNSFFEMIEGMNEVYNSNFVTKLIGKTIIKSPEVDLYPNIHELLNEDGEFCVLQYVYEISVKRTNSKVATEMRKKANYCSLLENKLKESVDKTKILEEQNFKIEELNNKIKMINAEKDELIKEKGTILEKLEEEIQKNEALLKSNSWKVTKPFRDLSSFLRRIVSKFRVKSR